MVHTALYWQAGGSGATGLVGLLTQAVAMRHPKIAIRSPRLQVEFRTSSRRGVFPGWNRKCRSHNLESGRKFDAVEFHDDASPEADRFALIGEKLLPSGDDTPFAYQDLPCLLNGECLIFWITS